MVGFDNGAQKEKILDGKNVRQVNANLTTASDTTRDLKRVRATRRQLALKLFRFRAARPRRKPPLPPPLKS